MLDAFQDALAVEEHASSNAGNARLNAMRQLIDEVATLLSPDLVSDPHLPPPPNISG